MIGNFSHLLQLLGLILIAYNLQQLKELRDCPTNRSAESEKPDFLRRQRIAWLDGPGHEPLETYMKHIREAFEYRGYKIVTGPQEINFQWDVMWIHDYSLTNSVYKKHIEKSSGSQIINHIPGSGYYSSKVALATCNTCLGVPQAFQLPDQKNDFIKFSKEHPDFLWVQKDNAHRNIKIKPVDELALTKSDSFIQRFVDKPLLVDNRKFDIGIYTVVTSLQPLKVYIYNGDALLRFCAHDYYPFDQNDVGKYVVGDDYTPIWEVPSLDKFYNKQKLGRRAAFDAWLKEKGEDPMKIWLQIGEIIGQANMSPNLSSGHFKQNQILYEQVLHSIFSLIGITSPFPSDIQEDLEKRSAESQIIASDKDIAVSIDVCFSVCSKCDEQTECQLCGHCMSVATKKMLRVAYQEHMSRQHMVRVQFDFKKIKPLTKEDQLLHLWFNLKCTENYSFC